MFLPKFLRKLKDRETQVFVFVHPDHEGAELSVRWEKGSWHGVAMDGTDEWAVSLKQLIEAGWISKSGGGVSSLVAHIDPLGNK
jgi:hypothetical protein